MRWVVLATLTPVGWVVWQGVRAMWVAWRLKWDVDDFAKGLFPEK